MHALKVVIVTSLVAATAIFLIRDLAMSHDRIRKEKDITHSLENQGFGVRSVSPSDDTAIVNTPDNTVYQVKLEDSYGQWTVVEDSQELLSSPPPKPENLTPVTSAPR